MALEVVILAAGKGTRMRSKKPKVLHEVAGKPLLKHVVDTAKSLSAERIHVIYGHEGEQVKSALLDDSINWIEQAKQLGTGHAVLQSLPFLEPANDVLILYADVPLLSKETLAELIHPEKKAELVLLTAELDEPFGLGRIVYHANQIVGIVEEKDASDEQKKIKEINSGVMFTKAKHLAGWLPRLSSNNAQGELYLTDIVDFAVKDGLKVAKHKVDNANEVQGVNDLLQLEEIERAYQLLTIEKLMRQGVTVRDKRRVDIRGELVCGQDVLIDVNTVFEGNVFLAHDVKVGANCLIRNSVIKQGAIIHDNSVIEDSTVGSKAQVGPFARLRPGSFLEECSKVGNFVEMKKTTLGKGSKVSHLSYIGDATVGHSVNIGAGTITCNYDGVNKHKTVIDNGAFIGSGTQLIAPIQVGENATIGAGTTLRKEAPSEALTLTKSQQLTINSWQRKEKS